ncbi:MAG: hypothetical protein K6A28_07445 [Bacteroidales bacterium]|nr:hypothetical protein [Bacteroidales bacterium]
MIELDDNFGLQDLSNVKKVSFEILYNKNRVSSWEGTMYVTADKVYYLVAPSSMAGKSIVDIGGAPKSWCIDISEIASYGKYGLGGFKIELKDGEVLRFTNVFRKTRAELTQALDERRS